MDQTHVASILTVYDLPVGKGKRFFSNTHPAVNYVISGWSFAGTQKYASGNLIRLTAPNGSLGTYLNADTTKANYNGGAIRTGLGRMDLDPNDPNKRWFTTTKNAAGTVTGSATFTSPDTFNWGTAAFYQSAFRNPPALSENLSVMKTFAVMERFNFKFRADAFNLFNRTTFSGINGTINNINFGRATSAADRRVITLGLRLDF
jgi:hypothetical protein